MRTVHAFAPSDKTKPIAILSTHPTDSSEGKKFVSEVLFVYAPSIETALYHLISGGDLPSSSWHPVQYFDSYEEAMKWAVDIAERWQYVENRSKGEETYKWMYDRFCPEHLKVETE